MAGSAWGSLKDIRPCTTRVPATENVGAAALKLETSFNLVQRSKTFILQNQTPKHSINFRTFFSYFRNFKTNYKLHL